MNGQHEAESRMLGRMRLPLLGGLGLRQLRSLCVSAARLLAERCGFMHLAQAGDHMGWYWRLPRGLYMCIYMYICTYQLFMFRGERERERERERYIYIYMENLAASKPARATRRQGLTKTKFRLLTLLIFVTWSPPVDGVSLLDIPFILQHMVSTQSY